MAARPKTKRTRTTKAPPDSEPAPTNPGRFRRMLGITLLSVIGPLAATFAGFYIYFVGGQYISTDNAYIKSEKIAVSADISGRAVKVEVRENQLLEQGALLFHIDPEPFRIALDRTEARLVSARQEIEALRALYKQKVAELKLAEGDVGFYQRQYDRQQKLNLRGFASGINLDSANRNLRNAGDRVAAIFQDIAQARAKLGGDPDMPLNSQPVVREAQSARDQAALDLRHTNVRAPAAGIVTNFELQPGEFIQAGKVVFSIVGSGKIWIHANYKETKLTHVRVGQKATIRVDAYPDEIREAVVTSISPATGAEFALLPSQNATGNWVKVVQRLPVRLELKNSNIDQPLRAGMSVIVEIDTGHTRHMPDFTRAALNWARDLI
jgi:membrane fusion protein (multidrug efflux system)